MLEDLRERPFPRYTVAAARPGPRARAGPVLLAPDVGAELTRWRENTKRLLDQLAATAERQDQLEAQVAALERDNEQLRRTLDELASEIRLLRTERASIAEILGALAADLSAT